MEILRLRHKSLQQALSTLEQGLIESQAAELKRIEYYTLMRDGTIQRFEYCIDSFWKLLKMYLETKQSLIPESSSPRSILRATLQTELITETECQILLQALSDRNLTSHSYNEILADTIYKNIPTYLTTMQTITIKLFHNI